MRIYPGTTVDYEFATLGGLGYTGTLNDRQFAALRAEGLTGSLPDMFGQFDGDLVEVLPAVPSSVRAWADFRQGGLEYVKGEPETLYGAPTFSAAGVSFDGTDDGLSWANGATAFSTPTGNFTFEAFDLVLTDGLVQGSLFGDEASGGPPRGFHVYYRLSTARLIIVCGTNTGVSQPTIATPPIGTPFHFCVERSGDNWTAYINGAVATTWTRDGTLNTTAIPFYVARRGGADFMKMSLAALRLSDGAIYGGAFTPPATPEYQRAAVSGEYGLRLGLGARSWFTGPPTMKDGNNLVFSGCVDLGGSGEVRLKHWNTATGYFKTLLVSATPGGDDHNEFGMIKLANGNYFMADPDHGSAIYNTYRGSSLTALTLLDIGPQLDPVPNGYDWSYANLIQLEGEVGSPIYAFMRQGQNQTYYSKSTDGGATWTAAVPWLRGVGIGARPYSQFFKTSPTRIDVLTSDGNPQEEAVCDIWHGYWEGGNWYKSDGTLIGASLPVTVTSLTKVYDAGADRSWTWDLKLINGEVVAAFASFPTLDTHRYHRGVLSGGVWTVETVVSNAGPSLYGVAPSGQDYYSGGICLHPTNKDILFASISDAGIQSGKHQLYRMNRVGADNYTPTQLTDEPYKSFRPDTVAGLLTYCKGTAAGDYESYTNFDGVIMMGAQV